MSLTGRLAAQILAITIWSMAAYIAANLILRAITEDVAAVPGEISPRAVTKESALEVRINPPEVGTTVAVPVVRPSRNDQQAASANGQ
jgi:hypothetical protein